MEHCSNTRAKSYWRSGYTLSLSLPDSRKVEGSFSCLQGYVIMYLLQLKNVLITNTKQIYHFQGSKPSSVPGKTNRVGRRRHRHICHVSESSCRQRTLWWGFHSFSQNGSSFLWRRCNISSLSRILAIFFTDVCAERVRHRFCSFEKVKKSFPSTLRSSKLMVMKCVIFQILAHIYSQHWLLPILLLICLFC